jgi:hypothetical protein
LAAAKMLAQTGRTRKERVKQREKWTRTRTEMEDRGKLNVPQSPNMIRRERKKKESDKSVVSSFDAAVVAAVSRQFAKPFVRVNLLINIGISRAIYILIFT